MTQTGDRVTRYLYDKDNLRVSVVDALGYLTEYKYDAGGRLIETVRYSHHTCVQRASSVPGHAFVQNLRRRHYELGVDIDPRHRIPAAFAELVHAI